jgi:hypothetical protein
MTSCLQNRRIVGDAVDAYVYWREECSAVWEAYLDLDELARVTASTASR